MDFAQPQDADDTISTWCRPCHSVRLKPGPVDGCRQNSDIIGWYAYLHISSKFMVLALTGRKQDQSYSEEKSTETFSLFFNPGRVCDKVGTSFTAFRFQTEGCSRPVGSCLSNQLLDLYDKDMNRSRDGLTPLHLLGRYSSVPQIQAVRTCEASFTLRHSVLVYRSIQCANFRLMNTIQLRKPQTYEHKRFVHFS